MNRPTNHPAIVLILLGMIAILGFVGPVSRLKTRTARSPRPHPGLKAKVPSIDSFSAAAPSSRHRGPTHRTGRHHHRRQPNRRHQGSGCPRNPHRSREETRGGPRRSRARRRGHVHPARIHRYARPYGGQAAGDARRVCLQALVGHGITTIRDPGSGNGLDWALDQKRQSAANEITAPRINPYLFFGAERDEPFTTPDQARAWVREIADRGAMGIKFFGYRPDIMEAALDEAGELGLGSACHHAQLSVTQVNVLDTARWGLTSHGALVRTARSAFHRIV